MTDAAGAITQAVAAASWREVARSFFTQYIVYNQVFTPRHTGWAGTPRGTACGLAEGAP